MNERRHDQTNGSGVPRRFVLLRQDGQNWVIHDRESHRATTRVAARITVTEDDEVHVTWLAVTPLPVVYATPEDVLASLEMWQARPHGGTKPIPIPHFPPPTQHGRQVGP
ncbi:hypothetical protein [Microbacterium terregens]|jgi:hypothetical protein|uniref:Uncharacterized protein n=1 Tax=Microbacterium terregens TaxID=69363 RepID=A0ABV5T203_9MICO